MKTQIALRLDETLVAVAKREASRQNRSLANLLESLMAESLMIVPGEVPVLTVVDDELEGAVALDEAGDIDVDATERFTRLLAIASHGRE